MGKVFAAVFVAEIGDVHRFDSPQALCSWAGLTPIHRESDSKVHRGRITKQGSRLVRWAAIEAVARYHGGEPFTEQVPGHRRTAWQDQGQRGHRPQSSHARLLRPAGRRDPLSRKTKGGVTLGHTGRVLG